MSIWQVITDPVYSAPILGASLISISTSLLGTIFFVRRKAMVGEMLSHAAYPGVIAALLLFAAYGGGSSLKLTIMILAGAFALVFFALSLSHFLEKRLHQNSDTVLTFLLSAFLGIGVFTAALLQQWAPGFFRQAESFLYGQIATMRLIHVQIYGVIALVTCIIYFTFLPRFKIILFDPLYPKARGISTWGLFLLLDLWTMGAIVVGMQSVGIILLIGMLIGPAAAAYPWSSSLLRMSQIALCIGLFCAFSGGYLSIVLAESSFPLFLPPGPLMVMIVTGCAFISLMIVPKKGYLWRMVFLLTFRLKCHLENILKALWKNRQGGKEPIDWGAYSITAYMSFLILLIKGDVDGGFPYVHLTDKGEKAGAYIVRKHRLWEFYLSHCLDQKGRVVHLSAEEIEHVMSETLEKELSLFLEDPPFDPHHQPIPRVKE